MSLVVRHKETGCYLQAHGAWTPQLDGAMRFNSGLRLVDYVEQGGADEQPERIEVLIVPALREEDSANAELPS